MDTGAGQASIIVMQRKGRTLNFYGRLLLAEKVSRNIRAGRLLSDIHGKLRPKVHKAQAIFNKIY